MKQNFTVRQGALDGVEAFLSVAKHRSFRRAAAELGVTPSAISQAVRALEARIGAVLFIRTTRSVGLTEAGERFLLRAKPAFEELVAGSEVARDLGQRPTGFRRPRSRHPFQGDMMIRTPRRHALGFIAALAASRALPAAAQTTSFPTRLIRLIVPQAPGANSDTFGRILAQALTERLGQQVVVENRAGAGGTVGSAL